MLNTANTSSGGAFAHINKPTAGPQKELALPKGSRPLQLYSLATPNGVKVTALLEELVDAYPDFEYDAWFTMIMGSQFGSGFVGANPNSKIPCMLHYAEGEKEPVRIFESASILMYLCDNVMSSFPCRSLRRAKKTINTMKEDPLQVCPPPLIRLPVCVSLRRSSTPSAVSAPPRARGSTPSA